ncbi:MAG: hypothetical protein ACRDWA_03945, partial [Acidimicrobiia bacterium]
MNESVMNPWSFAGPRQVVPIETTFERLQRANPEQNLSVLHEELLRTSQSTRRISMSSKTDIPEL